MKGDKCLLTGFDLICHIGQTPTKNILYEQDRTFRLSQFLVLEYQRNTGSQIIVLEYQIGHFNILRKLSGTVLLPCVVG